MSNLTNMSTTKKWFLRLLSSLLVLALMAGALPQTARAATCVKNYIVASGDTITGIAAEFSVTVAELATANDLKEPYTIYVGQSLCIPGSSTTTTTTTTTTSTTGFTIEAKGTSVVIKITNLGKKAVYVVKGKTAGRGENRWFKFGRVKTNKSGVGSATVRIPKSLRDVEYLTICLKHSTNDTVVCQNWRP